MIRTLNFRKDNDECVIPKDFFERALHETKCYLVIHGRKYTRERFRAFATTMEETNEKLCFVAPICSKGMEMVFTVDGNLQGTVTFENPNYGGDALNEVEAFTLLKSIFFD